MSSHLTSHQLKVNDLRQMAPQTVINNRVKSTLYVLGAPSAALVMGPHREAL